MTILKKIQQYFLHYLFYSKDTEPEMAYDLWAVSYDSQPDNLMLALDEEVFYGLLNHININNKLIADVGCGTGRHWKKILDNEPKKLIGFDVSEEMLKMLQQKFPEMLIRLNELLVLKLRNWFGVQMQFSSASLRALISEH